MLAEPRLRYVLINSQPCVYRNRSVLRHSTSVQDVDCCICHFMSFLGQNYGVGCTGSHGISFSPDAIDNSVCSLSRETYHTLRAMGHPPRLLRVLLSSSEVAEGQGQGPDPNNTNQENSTEGTRPDANAKARNRRPKRADKDGSFLEYFSPHTDHVPPALPVDRLLVRRTARKGAGALEYTMLGAFHLSSCRSRFS